ncbi:MAG: DUF5658 family protein [Steroidobacteraceae bacterium]
MNDSRPSGSGSSNTSDRREGPDRRRRHWYGLLVGHEKHRRQGPRRRQDRYLAVVDWHHPQWLLVAMLIVILSGVDGMLTIRLIAIGATEVNPAMAALVTGEGGNFAYWKMGLTVAGVIVLTALARLHLFGPIRVGAVLYVLLGAYVALVCYEVWLLSRIRIY